MIWFCFSDLFYDHNIWGNHCWLNFYLIVMVNIFRIMNFVIVLMIVMIVVMLMTMIMIMMMSMIVMIMMFMIVMIMLMQFLIRILSFYFVVMIIFRKRMMMMSMIFPITNTLFTDPVSMSNSNGMQNSVKNHEQEQRDNKDEWNNSLISLLIGICFRHNMNNSVADECSTGQAEQELD